MHRIAINRKINKQKVTYFRVSAVRTSFVSTGQKCKNAIQFEFKPTKTKISSQNWKINLFDCPKNLILISLNNFLDSFVFNRSHQHLFDNKANLPVLSLRRIWTQQQKRRNGEGAEVKWSFVFIPPEAYTCSAY